MVFSSLTFLFAFLPIALIGWYVLPKKWRIGFLLLISLVFYAWGEPLYVLLMIGSIVTNWAIGLIMDRSEKHKKLWLAVSVILNLSLLIAFKYTGFFWNTVRGLFPAPLSQKTVSIRLPIGISFFTFQIMSYVIDLYRGKAHVQKNPIKFGAYVAMFPQLIAGPIVRYVDIEAQLDAPERSIEGFSDGVRQFVIGLSKKVLLANTMAVLFEQLHTDPSEIGVIGSWVGVFAFSFQVYFDFSGYSDMACGLGRMLGFRFVRNFNYPYIAQSITDHWRRWYISLGTWFREYVYFPLGGSKKGVPRQIFNTLIVWALTGLWHGASWNFLLWGVYYGILLIIEKMFLEQHIRRLPRVLRHIYTLLIVAVGTELFAFTDLSEMARYLGSLFGIGSGGVLTPMSAAWCLGYLPMLLVCAFASTPVAANLVKRAERFRWFAPVRLIGTVALFLLCLAALASQSYNPFIYFRF